MTEGENGSRKIGIRYEMKKKMMVQIYIFQCDSIAHYY